MNYLINTAGIVGRKQAVVLPTGHDAFDTSYTAEKLDYFKLLAGIFFLYLYFALVHIIFPISNMDFANSVLVVWTKNWAGVWILPIWEV
jgi:hypothetical protein